MQTLAIWYSTIASIKKSKTNVHAQNEPLLPTVPVRTFITFTYYLFTYYLTPEKTPIGFLYQDILKPYYKKPMKNKYPLNVFSLFLTPFYLDLELLDDDDDDDDDEDEEEEEELLLLDLDDLPPPRRPRSSRLPLPRRRPRERLRLRELDELGKKVDQAFRNYSKM